MVLTILEIETDATARLSREAYWTNRLTAIGQRGYSGRARALTDDQVRMVRALQPKFGDSLLAKTAAKLGLDTQSLYRIRAGTTYKDVK